MMKMQGLDSLIRLFGFSDSESDSENSKTSEPGKLGCGCTALVGGNSELWSPNVSYGSPESSIERGTYPAPCDTNFTH